MKRLMKFLFVLSVFVVLCCPVHIYGRRNKAGGEKKKKKTNNGKAKENEKRPLYDRSKVKTTTEKALLDIIEAADDFDAGNKDEKRQKIAALKKAYMFFKEWKRQIGPDTAYGLGRRLLEYEDYIEAEDAFQHALKDVPKSPDAKLSLAIAQLQQGTYLSADKAHLTLGHIQPKTMGTNDRVSITQYIFGESLRQSFQYQDSLLVYEKFLTLKSNVTKDADVLQDVITSYFAACIESGEKPKLDLVRITCDKIKRFRCYEHLGGWYMRINKIKRAKKYFKKAMKLAGPKFKSFYNPQRSLFPINVDANIIDENIIAPEKIIVKHDFISLEEADGLADILDESIESYTKLPRRLCYKSGSAPYDLYPYLHKDKTKIGYDCLNRTVYINDENKMYVSNNVNHNDGDEGKGNSFNDKFSKHINTHMPSYSTSIFIDDGNIPLVKQIEHRIFETFGLNNRDGWPMQLLKYPTDVGYATHTDCTLERLDPLDRAFTVLVYLNHVRSGGSTKFPKLSKEVIAERGTVVVFSSLDADGHCSPLMVHEGMKVLGNKPKYILQKWYRRSGHGRRHSSSNYFSFHNEVKKKREPRILCDLSKSCREYIPVDYSLLQDLKKSEL
jgi:tetratricopeptide (TPR) repeat protein